MNREKMIEAWEDTIRGREKNFLDIEKTKHLLYDTYLYFATDSSENKFILREDLPIYRIISRIYEIWNKYPDSCKMWEFDAFVEFAEALRNGIEKGFPGGYLPNSLVLGMTYRVPAGGANPEADMSSFETFEKAFRNEVAAFKLDYDDEDDEDDSCV